MNIAVQTPKYPVNYAPGYIGFTIRKKDAIAFGIRWFESQWGELRGERIPSHAFVIVDQDRTVEAFFKGVNYGSIQAYLDDPDVALLVRRPYHWSWEGGQEIVSEAMRHIGHPYGYTLIAAMLVTHSTPGKLINKIPFLGERFTNLVSRIGDRKLEEICSEIAAIAMKAYPILSMRGILQSPTNTIDPYKLFYDAMCFEPPAYAVELVNHL